MQGHKKTYEVAIMEFWAKVEKTSTCWNWTGAITTNGYGRVWFQRSYPAHRFSYLLVNEDIPTDKILCHSCDNRACVNPAHLFLGSHKDNSQDMVAKDRHIRGERSHTAKLTAEDVISIRNSSLGPTQAGKKWGVSKGTISTIRAYTTWKHLP